MRIDNFYNLEILLSQVHIAFIHLCLYTKHKTNISKTDFIPIYNCIQKYVF